ncbi:hypothetical protein Csa_017800, partial [Cucumis sativus]
FPLSCPLKLMLGFQQLGKLLFSKLLCIECMHEKDEIALRKRINLSICTHCA